MAQSTDLLDTYTDLSIYMYTYMCLFDATIHAKDVLIPTGDVQKSVFIFQSILTTKQCQTVIKIALLHLGMYYQ